MVYFDNAATTFPKPPSVLDRMVEIYTRMGVSPGRGSYDLAVEAEELVTRTRRKVARFFGAPDPNRVVFASNATDALNILLQGLAKPGDHVVSTRLEHNSVLRPLNHLRMKGIMEYDLVPFDQKGFIDPEAIITTLKPATRLVILNHASNVVGTVQPVEAIGRLCAERGVPLFIDAAQSAGLVPIDMASWHVAGVAFTGHKSLLGPTGIGGLVLAPGVAIEPTRFGGTGVESRSLIHTETYPHRLEAGTLNLLGIIGLSEGLDFLEQEGIESIYRREMELLIRFRHGLSALDGVQLYGTDDVSHHVGFLTMNVRGMDPESVAAVLDADFGIAVRAGLHCAPLAHESLGTFPEGGVRFSLGPFNTAEDVDLALAAIAEIARIHRQ